MTNPYFPQLSDEDDEFVKAYIDKTIALARETEKPLVTREMSLYVLLDMNPSIVDKLHELELNGKGFYQDLCHRYETWRIYGAPQENYPSYEDDDEDWKKNIAKPSIDSKMIEILKKSLFALTRSDAVHVVGKGEVTNIKQHTREDRENSLFSSFVHGVYHTEKAEKEGFLSSLTSETSELDYDERSDLMEHYFFNGDSLVSELKPFLKKDYPSSDDKKSIGSYFSLRNLLVAYMLVSIGTCTYRKHHTDKHPEKNEKEPTIILLKENDITGQADTLKSRKIDTTLVYEIK